MTQLVAASPSASARVDAESAADLAARIHVPRRLPIRYDGQPMRHLSNSSYTRFLLCPEDWRRWYLKGERPPPSGAMFLGARVDDALTLYYRRQLEHGDALAPDQVADAYRDRWQAELAAENNDRGIDWDDGPDESRACELGRDALTLTLSELVPRLGRPVAVQRKLEFALAPDLEWTIQCYLDLETERTDEHGESAPAVIDYKVKTTTITQAKADCDPQAGLYLAARWLEGQPAGEFCFAQIAKPGARRKQMAAALITTTRTVGQQRATLARIAQAASQIAAYHARASAPTTRGDSPAPPAGSAHRATARTGTPAQAAPASSNACPPTRRTDARGARGRTSRAPCADRESPDAARPPTGRDLPPLAGRAGPPVALGRRPRLTSEGH
jgi:hypothetical protein